MGSLQFLSLNQISTYNKGFNLLFLTKPSLYDRRRNHQLVVEDVLLDVLT